LGPILTSINKRDRVIASSSEPAKYGGLNTIGAIRLGGTERHRSPPFLEDKQPGHLERFSEIRTV